MGLDRRRLKLQLTAFLSVAASGVHAGEASPTQQAAANVYFDCLVAAARGADDHVSDPSAVAARIEPTCTGPEAQEQARFRTTLSSASAAKFDQLWPDVRRATAVKAVLISRGAPALPAQR